MTFFLEHQDGIDNAQVGVCNSPLSVCGLLGLKALNLVKVPKFLNSDERKSQIQVSLVKVNVGAGKKARES